MKQKYYLIFGIVVIIGIALIGVYFYFIKPFIPSETLPSMTPLAYPAVFESGINISSEEDVKAIFDTNSEEIFTKTIEFVNTTTTIFRNYKQLLETRSSLFQYLTVEYDEYDEEQFYVVRIPSVSEDENWTYENGKVVVITKTCNDPTENMAIDIETGEGYCSSGIKETKKEVFHKLTYIVTNDGIVRFVRI